MAQNTLSGKQKHLKNEKRRMTVRSDDDLKGLVQRRVKKNDISTPDAYRYARSALLRGAEEYEREVDQILADGYGYLSDHDKEKIEHLRHWAILERRGAVRLDELEEEEKKKGS
ncbi:hypothetical protein Pan258_21440 [Symmachiella dynata]|uniref:hypothetical protein n=1 Tax=Symmachiella dynata TaxID=2527995 RepID=UPI00118C48BB|nr:hypothetical protein [Symmachiella dynata]QDT48104.1 hypothetical protein Pan258_21440 [Symmachiella dynata]